MKNRSWVPAFVLLATIWGGSFLFIKVAVDAGVAPVWVAFARCGFGALALVITLLATRVPIPRDLALWGHTAVLGVILAALPFTLFALGEQHVSSVVAGIWNATTPLFTLLVVMAALPSEPVSRARLVGLGTGFLGVLIVLGPWRGIGGGALWGDLACLGAAVSYGISFPYTRRFVAGRPESAIAISALQLLIASAVLAVVGAFVAPVPDSVPDWTVLASLAALGVLGTGLAYVLNYRVVRAAGATTAATVTYLVPLFSTVAGVAVLGEPLYWNEPAGAVLVLAGVAISQGRASVLAVRGTTRRAARPPTASTETSATHGPGITPEQQPLKIPRP